LCIVIITGVNRKINKIDRGGVKGGSLGSCDVHSQLRVSSAAFLNRSPQRFGALFECSDDSVLGLSIVDRRSELTTHRIEESAMARFCTIWRYGFVTLIVLVAQSSGRLALAQYTFVHDTAAAGTWDTPARWTGGPAGTYPNADGATVIFNQPIKDGSGLYTLTLPNTLTPDVTVGEITMNNAGFTNGTRTTIASGGGKLIFQNTSGPAKYTETLNANLMVGQNLQNQISATVEVASDLIIDQNNYQNLNTGTIFQGLINGASNRTITKTGVGGIQFNYGFALEAGEGFQGQYLIQQGAMRLINSSSAIAKSTGITVSAGGQLQLADNNAVAVSDYSMATGAVLNLNGNGTTAVNSSSTGGALRFGVFAAASTMTFHNPINLQTDSTISANGGTASVINQPVSGPGDLIKGGSGKLSLTAANTYTGDTRINNATLSITNPYLADVADVYMTTGGIFDLSFSGNDTIRSLYFDGVAQPVGTYGATGSSATNINDTFFTGTGVLNVTSLPIMGVPGDFNDNGVVDSADYVLWRKGGPLQNEVSDTGVNNDQDYVDWRARFGNTSGSGSSLGNSAAVPEPGTAALIVFALTAVVTVAYWKR
jgi:autotransporter-associated beta strand protein